LSLRVRFALGATALMCGLPLAAAAVPMAPPVGQPAQISPSALTALWLPFDGVWAVQRGVADPKAADDGRRIFQKVDNRGNIQNPGAKSRRANVSYYSWGAPVHATAEGDVVEAEDGIKDNPEPGTINRKKPLGNHVLIRHPDGDFTLLSHLKKGSVVLKAGDHVRCGDPVGRVGNSGDSAAPQLGVAQLGASDPPAPVAPLFTLYDTGSTLAGRTLVVAGTPRPGEFVDARENGLYVAPAAPSEVEYVPRPWQMSGGIGGESRPRTGGSSGGIATGGTVTAGPTTYGPSVSLPYIQEHASGPGSQGSVHPGPGNLRRGPGMLPPAAVAPPATTPTPMTHPAVPSATVPATPATPHGTPATPAVPATPATPATPHGTPATPAVPATPATPATPHGTPATPAVPATPATPATPHGTPTTPAVPATPATPAQPHETPATPAVPATPATPATPAKPTAVPATPAAPAAPAEVTVEPVVAPVVPPPKPVAAPVAPVAPVVPVPAAPVVTPAHSVATPATPAASPATPAVPATPDVPPAKPVAPPAAPAAPVAPAVTTPAPAPEPSNDSGDDGEQGGGKHKGRGADRNGDGVRDANQDNGKDDKSSGPEKPATPETNSPVPETKVVPGNPPADQGDNGNAGDDSGNDGGQGKGKSGKKNKD